jgi:hypothetical protein
VSSERLTIRSYRQVFRIDRRIYRVDRWTIPVPGGVPLRGIFYFVATLATLVVLGALPLIGSLVNALSPPLRYVVLPLAVAVMGLQVAPDGRLTHRFAWDWLRLRLRRRRRSAGRPVPLEGEPVAWAGELPHRPDERTPVLKRARVRGPAAVYFRDLVDVSRRRRRLVARPHGQRKGRRTGTTLDSVELADGEVLELRP